MDDMQEIRQAIILAAGRSRRMEGLSRQEPKCMLPYNGERILERMVRQIQNNGVETIFLVVGYCAKKIETLFEKNPCVKIIQNKYYEEDVNILSLKLALSRVTGPVTIFEADTVMEDAMVKYVLGADFDGRSVWFTRGNFNESQYGGILRSDKYGRITDIRIVSAYNERFKAYTKLSGVMRVGENELELFRALVNKYAQTSLKQYFLTAWIENLKLLPCWEADISAFQFYTFNKPNEYYQLQGTDFDYKAQNAEVHMVEVNKLHGIEAYDEKRVEKLLNKISNEQVWTVPVVVTQKTNLVLDGQHRLEVARRMQLTQVPAVSVDYSDVTAWSLRKEIKITPKKVEKFVLKENGLYPYKTVKHRFSFDIPDILIPIDKLR